MSSLLRGLADRKPPPDRRSGYLDLLRASRPLPAAPARNRFHPN